MNEYLLQRRCFGRDIQGIRFVPMGGGRAFSGVLKGGCVHDSRGEAKGTAAVTCGLTEKKVRACQENATFDRWPQTEAIRSATFAEEVDKAQDDSNKE